MRHRLVTLSLLCLAPFLGGCGEDEPVPESFVRAEPWDAETLRIAGTLPIQVDGRVKPLQSYAGFMLLHLNGKRSLKLPNGEKLKPTGFLLDCFFFPEQAKDYACFVVSNHEVVDAIGVESKGLRARYSYNELAVGRARLGQLAHEAIKREHRSIVDKQILSLSKAVSSFEGALTAVALARTELEVPEGVLTDVLGSETRRGVSHMIAAWPDVVAALRALPDDEAALQLQNYEDYGRAVHASIVDAGDAPMMFPPETTLSQREKWLNASDVVYQGLYVNEVPVDAATGWIARLEAMDAARNDRGTFRDELTALRDGIEREARRRGEYGRIKSEVSYYGVGLVMKSLVLYLLGFVLAALSWLNRKGRWLARASLSASTTATVSLAVAIAWRSYLRGRPPVLNLYDTILFITGIACIACLVIEAINRKRVGLSLTPIMGALGMFLAFRYEVKDAAINGDTMTQLQAVLDTNFWLATHVTTITAGYGAGLLATLISIAWIVCRLVGVRRGDKGFYRDLTKMAYGAICFGLLLSVVGTILGGVWANESWGRFWGWDPKENGALLICITELFILHSRLGGYVKQHGLHALSCVLGGVILFSWWHVNELDSGLHSYGRTEGVLFYLTTAYSILGGLAILAGGLWMFERAKLQARS